MSPEQTPAERGALSDSLPRALSVKSATSTLCAFPPSQRWQDGDYALHARTPRWQRHALLLVGWLALVTGAIGVVLPGLPTTPFVLIAAACFVRASPRAHGWLLSSRHFGPLLREWEQHHSVPRRVKITALLTMLASASISLWALSGHPRLQITVLIGIGIGAIIVLRLPTREAASSAPIRAQ
jgi:uncharacterized protein